MSKEQIELIEAWMREVTDVLVYQNDIPMDHKQSVVEAFAAFRKAIGQPLRP